MAVEPGERVVLGPGAAGFTDSRVADVENLYGHQLELPYDPAVVIAESIELDPFISPDWVLDEDIDNTNGVIAITVSQRHPTPARDGDGWLAQVRWQAMSPGTGTLTPMDVKLAEPGGARIPVEVASGEIDVLDETAMLRLYAPIVYAGAGDEQGQSQRRRYSE